MMGVRLLTWFLFGPPLAAEAEPGFIRADRYLELKTDRGRGLRQLLLQAAQELGDWRIELAGIVIDGPVLVRIADLATRGPLSRAAREVLSRPVDVTDLIYFLDDLLAAGRKGLRGQTVYLSPDRARSAGILLHPDDVFRKRPRRYPGKSDRLPIDRPVDLAKLPPAADGDPLGPAWAGRYMNPSGGEALLEALRAINPHFAAAVASLMAQLETQGAEVGLWSTVRNRQRGYLMWGAYRLSHLKTRQALQAVVRDLDQQNAEWGLDIPIRWLSEGDFRGTIEAARQMADALDVVYATRTGAERSNHYEGRAVDLTAYGLPRRLSLKAPDGGERAFDLAGPEEPRDLNLTPALITWIEAHFSVKKLLSDYPHWDEAP